MVSESGTFSRVARERLETSRGVLGGLSAHADEIGAVAARLVQAYRAGRQAIFFGNGGSAADAQHLAAEMVGKYYLHRAALPALALNVNTSVLTAVANDYSFDRVFARQLEAFGQPGDVAVGLSTSGNSLNVIEAIRVARRRGMVTVALTGRDGGRLRAETDHCICVPSDDTPRIQEGHIVVGHILCELVEAALFGDA